MLINQHLSIPYILILPVLLLSSCQSSNSIGQQVHVDSVESCATGMHIPSRFSKIKTDSLSSIQGVDNVKMILIKGGEFVMGSNSFVDAQPLHTVKLNSFYMDEHEVTNGQFARFVKETGYITVAEEELNPKDFPGVDSNMLVPGSAVFIGNRNIQELSNHLQWWDYIPGANWKHPEGGNSNLKGKLNHPVTQVAYRDAEAYAKWAGKRLPTEAEWEYAAKAGVHQAEKYYWGNDKLEKGKWLANIYQGKFPSENSKEDGFETTSPVKSFPANKYGLYDMEGNVWEWCSDFYRADYYTKDKITNPKGPKDSHDPLEPGQVKRVQRGGSFLCNDEYCERYKAGARGKGEINSPTNNVGFRCVKDI